MFKKKKENITINYCPNCGEKVKEGSIRCLKCGFYFVELEKVSKSEIMANTFENKSNTLENLTQNGISIKYPSYYKNAQLPKNDPECVIALAKDDGYCDIIIDIGDMHVNYIETKFEKEYKEYLMNMGYFNIIIHKGFGFNKACFETEIKSNVGTIKSIILIDFSKEKDIRITANSLKKYDYNPLNDLKIIIDNLIIN